MSLGIRIRPADSNASEYGAGSTSDLLRGGHGRVSDGQQQFAVEPAGLIVITNSSVDLNSYLVPRPGVRLKLADLTDAAPAWTWVKGINAGGDLIGWAGPSYGNVDFSFLLERVR